MALPAGFVEVRARGSVAWVRSDLEPLGLDALWREPAALVAARGRGGVGTLELREGLVAVARPFRRGGALGKVLGDRYPAPSRVTREVEVLCRLREQGVPVVTPLAGLARRGRAFWRLRLLTELEPDALPLPAFCERHPHARRWAIEAAAVAVRLAFAAGLRHPDLHPDNVLCRLCGDKVRAVLLDFDRARIVPKLADAQRDAMLVRMARYVFRHHKRFVGVLHRADFVRFLRALGFAGEPLRAICERLGAQLHKALRRRGLA